MATDIKIPDEQHALTVANPGGEMIQHPKWSGFFKIIKPTPELAKQTDSQTLGDHGSYGNYTFFQRLVQGSSSRLTRYREYDLADNDVEVARALDTIAEEMTGNNPKSNEPIELEITAFPGSIEGGGVRGTEVLTLRTALRRWGYIHDFENKLFNIARNLIKYGDCFFRKKNPFSKWEYIHPKNVIAAVVDKDDVTKILYWQIKTDIKKANSSYGTPITGHTDAEAEYVPKEQIVRFTLCDDMEETAPFGESILRPVYRAHKQKELLEDAIIIYRIQRAPERRVFYIDVGKMPPQRVKMYLEQIKNEIKQKKIPSQMGGQNEVQSVYNPQSMCISLDTKIPLLDGRVLTLQEMIDEHKQGKQNWVYSVDPETGKVAPGKVSWAGITRKQAEVIRITLDNGDQFVCTPDHKIPTQNRGFVEAQELKADDSLFPFTRRAAPLAKNKKYTYDQVFDISKNKWVYTHRMVAKFMRGYGEQQEYTFNEQYVDEKRLTIHHKDYNRFNNNPDNLLFMNSQDHILYHQSNDGIAHARQVLANIIQHNPEFKNEWQQKSGASLSKALTNNSDLRQKFIKNLRRNAKSFSNQRFEFSETLFNIVYKAIASAPTIKIDTLISYLNTSDKFMVEYTTLNLPNNSQLYKIKTEVFSKNTLKKLLRAYGYYSFKALREAIIYDKLITFNDDQLTRITARKSPVLLRCLLDLIQTVYSSTNYVLTNYLRHNREAWLSFVSVLNIHLNTTISAPDASIFDKIACYYSYSSYRKLIHALVLNNHKIVDIEHLPELQDTGTLTIDKEERYHKFHTFALTSCFVRNSEDFFFASRPDGKGSRVETLPGGQGLGELADLEYFQYKVWRGLRVPRSYMMEGQDGAMINDGKVGVAYIQELRFALFVMRLQAHVEVVLDNEFKKFLHHTNIIIDENIYRLRLPVPTNFGRYRQQELDAQLLTTFGSADGIPYMAKRFAMERYLQMTKEEIAINERMLREERGLDPEGGIEDYPAIYGGVEEGGGLGGGLGGGGFGGGGPLEAPAGMGGLEGGEEGLGGEEAGMEAGGGAAPAGPGTKV